MTTLNGGNLDKCLFCGGVFGRTLLHMTIMHDKLREVMCEEDYEAATCEHTY